MSEPRTLGKSPLRVWRRWYGIEWLKSDGTSYKRRLWACMTRRWRWGSSRKAISIADVPSEHIYLWPTELAAERARLELAKDYPAKRLRLVELAEVTK